MNIKSILAPHSDLKLPDVKKNRQRIKKSVFINPKKTKMNKEVAIAWLLTSSPGEYLLEAVGRT
jgi:hypothetical protein